MANSLTRTVSTLALLLGLWVAGCGGDSDLMPLDIGHSWNYIARSGFDTYVTTVKVTRHVSVGNVEGVELTSSLGATRLAWVGDELVAERLAGTQFAPPLPLLYKSRETSNRPWKGRVTFVDTASPASGTESQAPDDEVQLGAQKIHCTRSVVRIQTASHSIELLTWFAPGIGIVQQEQRTGGTLLMQLKLVGRP